MNCINTGSEPPGGISAQTGQMVRPHDFGRSNTNVCLDFEMFFRNALASTTSPKAARFMSRTASENRKGAILQRENRGRGIDTSNKGHRQGPGHSDTGTGGRWGGGDCSRGMAQFSAQPVLQTGTMHKCFVCRLWALTIRRNIKQTVAVRLHCGCKWHDYAIVFSEKMVNSSVHLL